MRFVDLHAWRPGSILRGLDTRRLDDLPPLGQPIAEKVIQLGNCVDLLGGSGDGVGDAVKRHGFAVKHDATSASVAIPRLSVGGMGSSPGSRRLHKSISATDEQRSQLLRIAEKGVPVALQMVPEPEERPVPLEAVLGVTPREGGGR